MLPPPPRSTLFPYTTLFRSAQGSVRSERVRLHPSMRGRSRSTRIDRKSTRLNSSHVAISYAVFCLKKKKNGLLIDAVHRVRLRQPRGPRGEAYDAHQNHELT